MTYCRRILVIEPYYGGSHKLFLGQLAEQLDLEFSLITLPARSWKWRMRFAAPWVASQLDKEMGVEAVLCSTFVDVAALRGLAPAWFNRLPLLTYFHENQFAYPVQVDDSRDLHFAVTNYLSALASDRLAFNSRYNLESFVAGCRDMEKRVPDIRLDSTAAITSKSTILPPGLDFRELDVLPQPLAGKGAVVVWNHRWEHDKNPELFFRTLFTLADEGMDFKVLVLGQSFRHQPAIFAEARDRLADRLLHFGYVPRRSDYLRLLKQGTLVVSTANHEFYGISVLEAVRAGCRPLLPRRLSYPELFAGNYLYDDDRQLLVQLRQLLGQSSGPLDTASAAELTDRYSWTQLAASYRQWLTL